MFITYYSVVFTKTNSTFRIHSLWMRRNLLKSETVEVINRHLKFGLNQPEISRRLYMEILEPR